MPVPPPTTIHYHDRWFGVFVSSMLLAFISAGLYSGSQWGGVVCGLLMPSALAWSHDTYHAFRRGPK